MRIAITGGSGFIGTRLAAELLAAGHDVAILDKVASGAYPDRSHAVDVRDPAALAARLAGVACVYHLAAEHRDDVRPIALYDQVNVDGARNLVAACRANNIRRIVFTSSVAVYGLNLAGTSEDAPPAPFNDYGRTKHAAELVFGEWADEHPARSLAMVRPAAIFGEGNRGNIYNLVRQINSGRFVMVGDGRNCKSMGYVGNLAAFLAFLGACAAPGVRILNYADKPDFSMNDLVALARRATGQGHSPPLRIPYWLGLAGGACLDLASGITGKSLPVSAVRIRKFCASTTIDVRRLQDTGFKPPFTLGEGMERFLAHEFGSAPR